MYAKIQGTNLIEYPYTWNNLYEENPYTHFGSASNLISTFATTEASVSGYKIVEVAISSQPSYNVATQNYTQNSSPTLENGEWVLGWTITNKTEDEINSYNQTLINNYKEEAKQALSQTDWVEIPSVTDTSTVPHLTNAADFLTYRKAIRSIVITPSLGVVWPILPNESWQTANGIVEVINTTN